MLCSMVCSNRSPLIRIPAARGLSTRIELRSVDPAANPYLAMAVILASGLDGIRKDLTPPAAVDRNIYKMTEGERELNGIDSLPSSLEYALIELEMDTVVRVYFLAIIFTINLPLLKKLSGINIVLASITGSVRSI